MQYPIAEIFHSIQTEGPLQGEPATFVRLARCNKKCAFCDTDFTETHKRTVEEILEVATHRLVVITGGEPFLYDLAPLVAALHEDAHVVQIETNGSTSVKGEEAPLRDAIIVCSPKATQDDPAQLFPPVSDVHPDILHLNPIFKLLVTSHTRLDHLKAYRDHTIYLQPLYGDADATANAVYLCRTLDVPLSVQWHKLINIP